MTTPMLIAASPTLNTKNGRNVTEVQVEEVDDIAVAGAVEDVADRSAQHHPERDLVGPVLLAPIH